MGAVWGRLGLGGFFAEVGAGRGAGALEHAVFAMVAYRLVAPCSKRCLVEWASEDVVMPAGWSAQSLDQYCRALDAVADAKEATEAHLASRAATRWQPASEREAHTSPSIVSQSARDGLPRITGGVGSYDERQDSHHRPPPVTNRTSSIGGAPLKGCP